MTNKKVLFITGAAIGMGYETCKLFIEKGYAIAFNDFNVENGEKALADFKKLTDDVIFLPGDATNENQVNDMVKKAADRFGRIDVVANNAGGLGGRQPIDEMTTEHWNKVMDLNLTSTFYVTRATVPYLKKQGGAIVNNTSIAAYSGGGPGASAYAVSKAGTLTFTRAMAKELIPFGIRVTAVSPGTVDTAFHAAAPKELIESWKAAIPAGRLGTPEEVAKVIYFLASDEASYLVGEVIQINGGQAFM